MQYENKHYTISTYNPDAAMQSAITNAIAKYGNADTTENDNASWQDILKGEISKWSDVLRAKTLYKNYPNQQPDSTASVGIMGNVPTLAFYVFLGIILYKIFK